MRRHHLRVGDRSQAGGTVVDGIGRTDCYGRQLTFIGAVVTCPICKGTGRIAARGPRWPGTTMDKVVALEGDVCECGCPKPPAMIASQETMFMEFKAHELGGLGFAATGGPIVIEPSTPAPSSTICLSCLVAAARNGAALIARE